MKRLPTTVIINCYRFSLLLVMISLSNCATNKTQYDKSVKEWDSEKSSNTNEIDHTFYLIGDGGNMSEGSLSSHFSELKKDINGSPENATLLFLGNNIYPKGMPEKDYSNRQQSEKYLDLQISLSEGFKGKTIFIPGNHDYYSDGTKGLEREADYITNKLNDKNAFLPENGCPLKKVDISDDIVLIVIDSQWFLEDWSNDPTMNDNCEIKTRDKFFDEFNGILKKNPTKTIIIALHHPMFTNGTHGGQFSWRQQLYPHDNGFPLPVYGSIANLIRRTGGFSTQDLQNPIYTDLRERIITLSQKSDKVIFVSGHEHNLQYIVKDNKPQIVSGSGSKYSSVKNKNGGTFSFSGIGYAKLDVYKNGAAFVEFYSEENGKRTLLFRTKVIAKDEITTNNSKFESFSKTAKSSIYSKEEVTKSRINRMVMGKHYRYVYGTEVMAPTVMLDTLFGGLTPIRSGGGQQSRSLRMVDENGKEYIMRALRKSATQFFQEAVFTNIYIGGQYDKTTSEGLLLDFFTTAHPYVPFVIGDLSDAIDVYHANPTLYYIPKQSALKHFNESYGDELYMIEERAASGHGNLSSFGYSNKLISSDDLFKALRKSEDNYVDEDAYIKARLFDMLIGDWDRHQDQWRWAEFRDGKKKMYRPVPRDRDQAFSKFDGFLLKSLTSIIYSISKMTVYDDDIKNVEKFNINGYPLDMNLINEASFDIWETNVNLLQKNITDDIIDKAFNNLPDEVNDATIDDIKTKLRARLKNLPEIAKEYYNFLEKYPIVKGTDKDNWFEIERLKNGDTKIEVFNIKNNKKGSRILHKIYSKKYTNEIWVYGLDDKDIFVVNGVKSNVIPLKLIGGQNNDEYRIESNSKVTVFDYKSKKNTFSSTKIKKRLTDDYELNTYNYKKIKNTHAIFFPFIGYNPDDGVNLSFITSYSVNGYNRNPFTQRHTIKGAYFFATNGFDVQYSGEFANIMNKWNFLLEGKITSPNYSLNFYGWGNDTKNFDDELGLDYNRVKNSSRAVYPSLEWIGRIGGQFSFGGLYESIEVEKTEGRFIETLPYVTEDRQYYTGVQSSYEFDNKDNNRFPTLGLNTKLDMGWKSNINNSDNFAYITPSLVITHRLDTKGKLVLSTKLKGNIIIGDNYEFYNAASIGGKDGLRGYRNQRFTGNKSFYQNTDLRYDFGKRRTRDAPLQLGLFAGFDYGRVWYENENSKDWKTSYGGGIWLVSADIININLAVFGSEEGARFTFGLGFSF